MADTYPVKQYAVKGELAPLPEGSETEVTLVGRFTCVGHAVLDQILLQGERFQAAIDVATEFHLTTMVHWNHVSPERILSGKRALAPIHIALEHSLANLIRRLLFDLQQLDLFLWFRLSSSLILYFYIFDGNGLLYLIHASCMFRWIFLRGVFFYLLGGKIVFLDKPLNLFLDFVGLRKELVELIFHGWVIVKRIFLSKPSCHRGVTHFNLIWNVALTWHI